jgi:hypothetical protein
MQECFTQVIFKEMANNSKRAAIEKTQFHPPDDYHLKLNFLLKVILEKGEATTSSSITPAAATAN